MAEWVEAASRLRELEREHGLVPGFLRFMAGGESNPPQAGQQGGGGEGGGAQAGGQNPPANQGQTGNPPGAEPPPNGDTAPKFTQADLDRITGAARAEERKKAQDKLDADKRAADAKRAEEQGEWEKLAKTREGEVTTLTADRDSWKSKAERAEAALKANIEAQTKDLPDYIKDVVSKLDPVEQLEYLSKHRDQLNPKNGPLHMSPKQNGQPVQTGAAVASDYVTRTYGKAKAS